MTTYYKATRPDGYDFWSGTVLYEVGKVVEHPTSKKYSDTCDNDPSTYLSVATVPTDCTGSSWPCRLIELEGVGRARTHRGYPNTRGFRAVKVLRELPAHEVFGPQAEEVVALIERCKTLTKDEVGRLTAAWAAAWDAAGDTAWDAAWAAAGDAAGDTAWDAAWAAAGDTARDTAWDAAWAAAGDTARDAAWAAAGDTARYAAWAAARDAACALVVRDLITPEQFDILYGPWREVIEGEQ